MGQPSITEIEANLKDWNLLKQLPQQVGSFQLVPGTGIKGQILNIAAYVNEAARCRLDLTYTAETFDYVPVKTVGLHVFRDERLFYRDKEQFATMFLADLPRLIGEIDMEQPHCMNYEARPLGFEKWDYWHSLPKQMERGRKPRLRPLAFPRQAVSYMPCSRCLAMWSLRVSARWASSVVGMITRETR